MTAILTLTRYPDRFRFFAMLSMAVFRPFIWFRPRMPFCKLLGCGRNGSFDLYPDWNQYGIFSVCSELPSIKNYEYWKKSYYGKFISGWWRFFGTETWTIVLLPLQSQGKWDGRELFSDVHALENHDGPLAVLTRATIRLSKIRSFWLNVAPVAAAMRKAEGLVFSVGIGEMPVKKQATFSIWESSAHMKEFAYRMREHQDVIRKTRKEDWYAEELFVRFIPVQHMGSLQGVDPLANR